MISDPLPSDPIGQRLCKIFSYPWKTIEGESIINTDKPNWRTIENYPLRPRSLYQKFLDPSVVIGVRFGKTTTYGLIDIDRGSKYLTLAGINEISAALETIGIVRTIPIRSSASGGLHLYIPLSSEVSTFDLASSLKICLESQGLEIAPGQLETFPNVKAYKNWRAGFFGEYNAHRLPLQPGSGSVMLSNSLQPMPATLERFFYSWDFAAKAQDLQLLKPALSAGRNAIRKRRRTRSHPVESWRLDLEHVFSEGFTGPHQTNSLLKDVACYGRVFLRLAGDSLIEFVQKKIMDLPGFDLHCRHQLDIGRRARSWALAALNYYWPLGEVMKRDRAALDHNQIKADDAKARIIDAVTTLKADGSLADTVRGRLAQIATAARTSATTLYKHLNLWHPAHMPVTAHPATITPPSPPDNEATAPTAIASQNEPLHTDPELMKGVGLETRLKNLFSGGIDGGLGEERGFSPPGLPC